MRLVNTPDDRALSTVPQLLAPPHLAPHVSSTVCSYRVFRFHYAFSPYIPFSEILEEICGMGTFLMRVASACSG